MNCRLVVHDDVDDLYKLFINEPLESERAKCKITKNKDLVFEVEAKDATSMKAFMNSILNTIQVYHKLK